MMFLKEIRLKTCVKIQLKCVPNEYKAQKMCETAVKQESYILKFVVHHYKTQGMCYEAIQEDRCMLGYVLYWFVTSKILKEFGGYSCFIIFI